MKNMKKKGFTIVELVIVIAVVAVLAAVLIPTFASLIKKANDSAYLQERTNQQIADLAEKVTNQNYLTWEDFESKLAEKLAAINKDALTEADISTAIEQALKEFAAANQGQNTGLTEDQVKKIVEKAMEGQLTTAQVEAIVKAAVDGIEIPAMPEGLTEDQVKTIVDEAIKKLQGSIGNTGITKAQMEAAINEAIRAALEGVTGAPDEATLKALIDKALAAFANETLSPERLKEIIDGLLDNAKATEIEIEEGQTVKDALVEAVKNAPDGAVLKLPENSTPQMAKGGLYWLGQALKLEGGSAKHITIDLNGNTMSSTGSNAIFTRTEDGTGWLVDENGDYVMNILEVPANGELSLKNGSITVEHGAAAALATFMTSTGSSLHLTDMTINTSTAGILPAGDASEVVIENCTINALNYALATNRAESALIRIVINNSTLTATHSTAVMINTSADAHINNSTIIGVVHGVILRAGSLEIKDSTIITNDSNPGIYSANNFAEGYGFQGFWGTGNTIPAGTIVVGDYTQPYGAGVFSYSGNSILTLSNTMLQSAVDGAMPEILIAAYDPNKTASVSYDESCTVGDVVIYGSNWTGADDNVGLTFTHNGKIVVNGVTESVTSYYHIPAFVGTFNAGEYAVSALNVNNPDVAGYDYNATVREQIQTAWGLTLTDKEWKSVTMNFSSATSNQLKTISYTKEDGTATTYGPSRINLTGIDGLGLLNSQSVSVLKKSANYLDVFTDYCTAAGITVTDSSKFVIGDTANVIVGIK